jgi:hypothetical protein
VTPPDMPEWGTVSMIEPSHFDEGTAYVAVDRHKLDDNRPIFSRQPTAARPGRSMGTGIPEGAVVHAVREDTVNRDLLYAATETGVLRLFRSRRHWQTLQLNLPQSPVHDLVVKGDDLVVATHGRSFWILDDVTPLRQIASATTDADVALHAAEYLPPLLSRRRSIRAGRSEPIRRPAR